MLIKNQNNGIKKHYEIINDINQNKDLGINYKLIEDILRLISNKDIINLNVNDEFNILCFLINNCINQETIEQHDNILKMFFEKDNIDKIINGFDNNKKVIFLQSLVTNTFIREYIYQNKIIHTDLKEYTKKIINEIYKSIMPENLTFNISYINYDGEDHIVLNLLYKAEFSLIPIDKENFLSHYKQYASKLITYIEIKHPYLNFIVYDNKDHKNIHVRKLEMLNENINVNEILTNYITSLTLINTKYNDLIKSYTSQIERKNIEEERIIERNLELEHDTQYEERLNFNVKVYEGENGNRYYHCTKCKHYYDNESESRYCQCMR
jgi:hypothetical protein